MPDNRNSSPLCGASRDSVYIDTHRILDSCRDKDCFEDVPVYLSDVGAELIERSPGVRVKCARIVCANITVDAIPFNRGFYQIQITMYVKITAEVCACLGRPQEIDGVAVVEKKVILYGGEGTVNIFRSEAVQNFCSCGASEMGKTNLPTAVFEVADPIVLNSRIVEACDCKCYPHISPEDLPQEVCGCLGGRLCPDMPRKFLTVSLGFFSVVRMERPAQYLVHGVEYTIPEKECSAPGVDDPCKMFRHMAFPVNEFYPPSLCDVRPNEEGGCGCKR